MRGHQSALLNWGLRDYGTGADQLGLEPQPDCAGAFTGIACGECYVCRLVAVFREVRRVLRDDGTLWLVLGDSYSTQAGQGFIPGGGGQGQRWKRDLNKTWQPNRARIPGLRPKSLVGIPWRVALALQADGWILRSDIIWAKRNPMPESVRDRCTRSHEHVFMLAKQAKYYFDAEAVREVSTKSLRATAGQEYDRTCGNRNGEGKSTLGPGREGGRNKRDVWHLSSTPFAPAHFATFPASLVEPMILAATSERGVCPACGAPWERVVGKESIALRPNSGSIRGSQPNHYRHMGNPQRGNMTCYTETLGWQPTCPCDAGDPVPATVLDPFGGAGTVALVAQEHGRHAVIIERNPDYIELSRARLGAVSEIPNRKATA